MNMKLKSLNKKITNLKTTRRELRKLLIVEKKALQEAKVAIESNELLRDALADLSQTVQTKLHETIAGMVTRCLQVVFDNSYSFAVQARRTKTRSEVKFKLTKGDKELDLMDCCGGGVLDVVAFALRLTCLLLTQDKGDRLLVLDEPFKFVSAQHRASIAMLLDDLSQELNIQIVMVTHTPELQIGNVVPLDSSL